MLYPLSYGREFEVVDQSGPAAVRIVSRQLARTNHRAAIEPGERGSGDCLASGLNRFATHTAKTRNTNTVATISETAALLNAIVITPSWIAVP